MSDEIFQLVQELDYNQVETQLALQCAPLLIGVKISNLLIIRNESLKKVEEILQGTGISRYILMESEEKATLLLCKENETKEFLSGKRARTLLNKLGYKRFSFEELLFQVKERYEKHMNEGSGFPHEMGLLLGYPVEDVNGFIKNRGKNFLYSGYWKVYEDLPEKLHLFHTFEQAKQTVLQLIFGGLSIKEIITIYHDNDNYHGNELQQLAV